jgi:Fe-S oxidoreductase
MLTLPEQFLFVVLLIISLYYAAIGFIEVINAIRRGAGTYYPRTNYPAARIWDALVRTITQVTVFRDRPVVSFFHSFVFYGFIFYGAVNLWDVVEGYVPADLLAPIHHSMIGGLFRLGADLFGTLVLIGVAYLLYRRFAMEDPKLERFNPTVLLHPGVTQGGIRRDSIIVGSFILLHVGLRMFGSASLLAAGGHGDPWQPVATMMSNLMGHSPDWILGWHIGWWGALGLILAFLPYFPRSKHIHLFAAPARFALERHLADGSRVPLGALEPLDLEDENAEQFGVERLEQLRFTQLLDPYACIQCNRCTNACPAHTTGKSLAPSAIEINKRYELNAIRPAFAAKRSGSRPVMEFVMNESALWACTACGACVEVCPVGCEQLSDIIDYRRDAVMTKGEFPQQLNNAFRNLERTSNPWGIAAAKREEWKDTATIAPTVEENPDFEVLYWVGCAGAYDPSAQKTARAFAEIMNHAKVNFAILGKSEGCTGDPARRAGNEYLYHSLATGNVETLNAVLIDEKLDASKPKRVVATCPHCFNALKNDYPQLGGNYKVVHHTQLIEELIAAGRLPEMILEEKFTYHDPCYLGRHNEVYAAPRAVLTGDGKAGAAFAEMPRHKNNSFCCGAGGAQFWKEEEPGTMKVAENRFREAEGTGAKKIAAGCPFCKSMLASSESAGREGAPEVLDIAELVAENLRRTKAKLGLAG